MTLHQESHSESHPWIKCVFEPFPRAWGWVSCTLPTMPYPTLLLLSPWPPSAATWFITPASPSAPSRLFDFSIDIYDHPTCMHFSCSAGDGERASTDHEELSNKQRERGGEKRHTISLIACLELRVQQSCLLYVPWVQRLANTPPSVSAHLLVHVKIFRLQRERDERHPAASSRSQARRAATCWRFIRGMKGSRGAAKSFKAWPSPPLVTKVAQRVLRGLWRNLASLTLSYAHLSTLPGLRWPPPCVCLCEYLCVFLVFIRCSVWLCLGYEFHARQCSAPRCVWRWSLEEKKKKKKWPSIEANIPLLWSLFEKATGFPPLCSAAKLSDEYELHDISIWYRL